MRVISRARYEKSKYNKTINIHYFNVTSVLLFIVSGYPEIYIYYKEAVRYHHFVSLKITQYTFLTI